MTRSIPGLGTILFLFTAACTQPGGEGASEAGTLGDAEVDGQSEIEMVYLPEGSFVMGSNNADDEDPIHEVRLSGFFIGKYEVTQRQWREVMGSNPSEFVGDDRPVENVSWEDARVYAARLSERTGEDYRLPTEAEWEYAARAGSRTDFHFGDDTLSLGDYAWYAGNSGGETHPVGQKRANAWGLYDVAGNVGEWCQDWWDPDFYERSGYEDPVNEVEYVFVSQRTNEESVNRVVRSGSFGMPPAGVESAHRHAGRPGQKRSTTGFRLVRKPRR